MKNNKLKINTYLIRMLVFALVIFCLFFVGLLAPLRPSFSESEKRELAKFPKFSIEALFNGTYFSEIGIWYSDTYPGREQLIGLNTKIKELYGFSGKGQIHGEVVEGDDIPDEFVEVEDPTEEEEEITRPSFVVEGLDTQSLGAVFVAGNVGYEYYNFSQTVANKYVNAMNSIGDRLSGHANFYNMIVPTSIGVTLPDNYMSSINSSDQEKAIQYMNSGMNSNVIKVPIFDALISHRKEYIYFNTDHHWTSLGAYYAYQEFCKNSNNTDVPLSNYKKVEYDGFLGSFYNDTGKLPSLESNPDTLVAYIPNENAKMVYTDKKGNSYPWPVVNNVSSYGATLKYSAFIGGDNPFTEITNPDITDESSIVVVKESFGNAFVPFLVENYSKIYIIDYRYYQGSVVDFVLKNNVKDVLYINNISATRNKGLISKLEETI